jgi:hypothetical protein
MSHPSIHQLAAGALTRTDELSVEMHESPKSRPFLLILWPRDATRCDCTPQAIADIGRNLVRTLATAQAELVRQQHRGG